MSSTGGQDLFVGSQCAHRRTVKEIQKEVKKRSERHRIIRFLHSGNDKDVIAGWNSDLSKLLQVFNVRSTCLCLVAADLFL